MGTWHARIPIREVVHRAHGPTELAVLLILYKYADRGGEVSIGTRALAAQAGIHKETTQNAVGRLIGRGVIECIYVGRGRAPSRYRVPIVLLTNRTARSGPAPAARPSTGLSTGAVAGGSGERYGAVAGGSGERYEGRSGRIRGTITGTPYGSTPTATGAARSAGPPPFKCDRCRIPERHTHFPVPA